jgi:hypothetical protein
VDGVASAIGAGSERLDLDAEHDRFAVERDRERYTMPSSTISILASPMSGGRKLRLHL